MFMDPFASLKAQYVAGVRAKLPEMAAWLEAGALVDLRAAAHRLAGSGGFYGFDAISTAGRHLEAEIDRILGGTSVGALSPHPPALAADDRAALQAAFGALAAAIEQAGENHHEGR
jgi:HPt (histidine-containing phosphotransfer) domain-containing protein